MNTEQNKYVCKHNIISSSHTYVTIHYSKYNNVRGAHAMIIVLRRHIGIVVVSLFLLIAGIFLGRYGIPAAQTVSNLVSTRRVPIYKVDTDEKKIAFSF